MRLSVSLMRGGTSKAAVLVESELPQNQAERDALLVRLMGGGDGYARQLDGLGGATSSTSKVAIVSPATDDPDADVLFRFAQVGIERPTVDYSGTCGNISAAIGPFAIDSGLVAATERLTTVRVRNLNTDSVYLARVPTINGRFDPEGDFAIPGVSGTGSRIDLEYLDPAGAVTGLLFPTGHRRETIDGLEVSVLDVANPVVFLRAADLGVDVTSRIPHDAALLGRLERIRREASVRAGIAADADQAGVVVVPRVALVDADDRATVRGAMVSAGLPHAAYPLTGALATAAAARLHGTVVHDVAGETAGPVVVRHPAGLMELDIELDGDRVARIISSRTARTLMTGWADVPLPATSPNDTSKDR